MAKPKFAGKKHKTTPAPLTGVLVPRDDDVPVVIKALSTNPELEKYAALTAIHIMQHWSALASVDATEICRVERRSCRFCHGIDHRYQWVSEEEWAMEVADAIERGREPKPCDGGFGFSPKAAPSSTCPSCFGDGVAHVHLADSRELSPAARLLFNGAEHTKYGVKVTLRDRDAILDRAAKFLGMYKEQVEHTGKGGGPLQFILSPAEAAL